MGTYSLQLQDCTGPTNVRTKLLRCIFNAPGGVSAIRILIERSLRINFVLEMDKKNTVNYLHIYPKVITFFETDNLRRRLKRKKTVYAVPLKLFVSEILRVVEPVKMFNDPVGWYHIYFLLFCLISFYEELVDYSFILSSTYAPTHTLTYTYAYI